MDFKKFQFFHPTPLEEKNSPHKKLNNKAKHILFVFKWFGKKSDFYVVGSDWNFLVRNHPSYKVNSQLKFGNSPNIFAPPPPFGEFSSNFGSFIFWGSPNEREMIILSAHNNSSSQPFHSQMVKGAFQKINKMAKLGTLYQQPLSQPL